MELDAQLPIDKDAGFDGRGCVRAYGGGRGAVTAILGRCELKLELGTGFDFRFRLS